MNDVLQLLVGFALLIGGAELMVRGAVWLAVNLGVRPMVVGLTVVAFGTSAPELVVSLIASFQDRGGMAVGTVFGSNVANIALILGLSAAISPLHHPAAAARFETVVMVIAALLTVPALAIGEIEHVQGGILVTILVYFVWRLIRRRERVTNPDDDSAATSRRDAFVNLLSLGAGITALGFGADQLVAGASSIARALGMSDTAVAVLIIAGGTSLPELATSAVAAVRGQTEIALGNVIGSNIFNICWVLGATALIRPLAVTFDVDGPHVLVALAMTLILVAVLHVRDGIGRISGIAFVLVYVGYLTWTMLAK